jgi:transposase InsO family protein
VRERDAVPAGPIDLGSSPAQASGLVEAPLPQSPLYLAVVLDAFSRRIIGWAMGHNLKAQLVLDALNMAIEQRKPYDVIHHSDQGSQYTSVAFGLRCKKLVCDHQWDR